MENPLEAGELAAAISDIIDINKRLYKITAAKLSDGYCNYDFEITDGIGVGDKLSGQGNHVVKDDMRDAFAKFNVHLAVADDIFKHAGIEIENIDLMHNHEFAYLYTVTGFKMGGSDESESIVLMGNKYVSGGGRISLVTPKIMIDNLAWYKWWNELKAAADLCREEVALYKEGKYIIEEEEAEKMPNPKQGKISFGIQAGSKRKGKKADAVDNEEGGDPQLNGEESNSEQEEAADYQEPDNGVTVFNMVEAGEVADDDMSDFEKASI